MVVFTASSTVTHFCGLFDEEEAARIRANVQAACIGPITAATARDAGFEVAVEATEYTLDGVVDALVRWRVE